jgi:hypothetical protein
METVLLAMGASAGTAATASTIFSTISTVASVVSGISQIAGGSQQESLYQAQAAQAKIQSRGEAVKYEQQANSIARRALEAQAMARARAAAGGIDPFSGSAQFIQDLSAQDAGEEIDLSRENAKLAALGGSAQVDALLRAGRTSRTRGLLSGLTTAGMGLARASQIGGPVAAPRSGGPTSALNTWGMPAYG